MSDSVNTTFSFMKAARNIMDTGMFLNKGYMRNFGVQEQCHKLARDILGKDMDTYFNDESGIRYYITNVFGKLGMLLCFDSLGNISLDIEHLLILWRKLLLSDAPEDIERAKKAQGVLYYIAGLRLQEEFEALIKVSVKSRIKPIYKIHAQTFSWDRCNLVLRKYMLPLTVPEGYNGYYYEKKNLALLAYLYSKGYSVKEADEFLEKHEGGLFYSGMPKEIENDLIQFILSGGYNGLDGIYSATFNKDMAKIESEFSSDIESHNVYNLHVKPNMIKFTGLAVAHIDEEIDKLLNTGVLNKSDIAYNHISPYRVGIILKDNIKVEQALPNCSSILKPVISLDTASLAKGVYL